MCVCLRQEDLLEGVGPEKVNSYSSLSHTNTGIHTHMPAPKGSSREAQRRLCAGQISHVSLLQHTDRSSRYSLLYEGQVHACRCERKKRGGRKRVGKKLQPKPLLSFLFSHFPLVSCLPCLSLSLSLHTLPLFSPSLRRGIQSLRWDWSSLKVIQNCTARCLCCRHCSPAYLPSSITPLPSTLRSHLSALRGPGSHSTKSRRAPNPGLGLALLPQASLAVPLHHRETRRWEAWEEKSKGGMT